MVEALKSNAAARRRRRGARASRKAGAWASRGRNQVPVVFLAIVVSTLLVWQWQADAARTDRLDAHVVIGASVPGLPGDRTGLLALERALGAHLAIASAFVDWTYVIGGPHTRLMADGGSRKVLLSWEPYGTRFTDVTSGARDHYLQRVADSMRDFPYDVFVRPWPEMNGNWSTWQPTTEGDKPDGGTPTQFVAAWRYLVTFMRSRGVTHLKFVFAPDASDAPNSTPVATIWPGSQYVDVLGMDGYNWGDTRRGADAVEHWQSFSQIFAPMYAALTRLDPSAAVWITELGSKEPRKEDDWLYPQESSPADPAHSKATWIDEMMHSTIFPRVQALVFFNKQKERDWRLNSSTEALTAIRRYMS